MSALWIPAFLAYLAVGIFVSGWVLYKIISGPMAACLHILFGLLWIALPVLIFFGAQQ